MIDFIEFNSEMTKFRNEDQYDVTLNTRSKRKARNTERPNVSSLKCDQTTSNMDPVITIQSKRLNADSKCFRSPIA